MAGLLDDYGIDWNDIPDSDFSEPEPGFYSFEIGDFYRQEGTSKDADKVSLVIAYLLGDEGQRKTEWFGLPKDPTNPTDKELTTLSIFKQRLASLAIPRERWNSLEPEDFIGITGTLSIYKNRDWLNIKNVRVDDQPTEAAPMVRTKRQAPATKAEPAAEPEAATPARARRTTTPAAETAVDNPFAGRRRGRGSEDA